MVRSPTRDAHLLPRKHVAEIHFLSFEADPAAARHREMRVDMIKARMNRLTFADGSRTGSPGGALPRWPIGCRRRRIFFIWSRHQHPAALAGSGASSAACQDRGLAGRESRDAVRRARVTALVPRAAAKSGRQNDQSLSRKFNDANGFTAFNKHNRLSQLRSMHLLVISLLFNFSIPLSRMLRDMRLCRCSNDQCGLPAGE
jgi:hypothetical protein